MVSVEIKCARFKIRLIKGTRNWFSFIFRERAILSCIARGGFSKIASRVPQFYTISMGNS